MNEPQLFHGETITYKLFDLAIDLALDEGGDGWTAIVTRHPERIARYFEQYLWDKPWGFGTESVGGALVFYLGEQEGVYFSSKFDLKEQHGDNVLVIPFTVGAD